MIREFLAAFPLFIDAWSTTLLLALVLPVFGVVMLLRQQVFLGAAVAQAAGLGYALALWLGVAADGHDHAPLLLLAGLGAAVGTAWSVLRSLSRRGTEMEARAAIVFLVGGAGAMVLFADDPHGMHEVQRMFLSSLLGADGVDVIAAAALVVVTAMGVATCGRQVASWAIDPVTAAAVGVRISRYDLGVGLWLGAGLAFAIHVGGLLFAFGAAALPALLARELCRSLRAAAIAAPLLGLGVGLLGLVLAHATDRPPGQAVAALHGLALLAVRAARMVSGVRRR